MATRLKKMMQPILKQKCSESFKAGFSEGLSKGWQNKLESYENQIKYLKLMVGALTHSKWIPVTEMLPEHFGVYLITVQEETGKRYSDAADYDSFQKRWRAYLHTGPRAEVTHWMPLPEPPKEDLL